MQWLTWLGIAFCLSQSAMFSGLNLAFFSVSKLRLEVEARAGNRHARRILALRRRANFLLVTILWGNVGINVLLTLLADSVLAGIGAFLFSTVAITFIGEIIPQAWFSRHAMRAGSLLSPVLRFYQALLFPIVWPTSLALDRWLGPEGIAYFREKDLPELIRLHVQSPQSDIGATEGRGALNFMAIDDLPIGEEGETVDPATVISLPFAGDRPQWPAFARETGDEFLRRLGATDRKWAIVTDPAGEPRLALDAEGFLRDALFGGDSFRPFAHCHRPVIVRDPAARLESAILKLKVEPEKHGDDVIDDDIILLWGDRARKVITGADLLGRLLRGIVRVATEPEAPAESGLSPG